ncbi:MAG: hypothetical protein QQN41_06035, partial [Nitrosopumilus sp.]
MGSYGDSNNLITTYSPYKQILMQGDQSNVVLNNPGVEMHIGKNFLATLKRVITNEKYASYEAGNAIPDKESGYVRTASSLVSKLKYKLQMNASLNKEAYIAGLRKNAENEFYASLSTGETSAHLYAKIAQLNASAPPGPQDSATGKVSPLT